MPFHRSHFAILRDRWRRLAQALIVIALMLALVKLNGPDSGLTAAGAVAGLVALTLSAIRDERLGFRVDAAIKVVVFLLLLAITALLWATTRDREKDRGPLENFYEPDREPDLGSLGKLYEPAFLTGVFVVTMVVLLLVRAVDLVRRHLHLAIRPPNLTLDQQGFAIQAPGTRAFVMWHHLERVSVAGHTLVVSYQPGRPDSERPPSFRWSPELSGYRAADLRHFTDDRAEFLRSLGHFAGPIYQPGG